MKETTKIMMALLRSAVCGATLAEEIKENMTAERLTKLYVLSAHHDMAHLVAEALSCAGLADGEVGARFRREQMLAAFRAEGMTAALAQISDTLSGHGIPHIPLKGAVMRSLYPEAWMRTSCDIDVLVTPETLAAAQTALCEEAGYRKEGNGEYDVALTSDGGVHLELHYDTMQEDRVANATEVLGEFWQHVHPETEGGYCYRLSDEMFYFYHIAHMAKHFCEGGCGVRPFLDLWLLRHRVEYDGAARRRLLERGGLVAFAEAAEHLSEVWFSDEPWDALAEDMSRYLLRAGTYGVAETYMAAGHVRAGSKFKNIFARIWQPYDILRRRYPSLEGRRWLTFFYQIRRWMNVFRRGKLRQSVEEFRAGATVTDAQTGEISSLLTRLEL